MLARVLAILVVALPGWGQFTQLATTDDAQQLYFVSPLTLSTSSSAAPEVRIYRFSADGIVLFAERGPLTPVFTGSSFSASGDGVSAPQVSGDGSVVAITAHNICPNGGSCVPSPVEGLLRGALMTDLGPGTLQLSRNGRWAVLRQIAFSNGSVNVSATLFDLQANQSAPIPPPPADYWMVASNGAVLVQQNIGGIGLWQRGRFFHLTIPGAIRPLALSDDAAMLVFARTGQTGAGPSLIERNLATAAETTLYASDAPTRLPNLLGLSNDGKQVLYNVWDSQAAGPAYLFDASSGVSAQIPLDPEEIVNAGTLGGAGNAGYVATSEGRIVRFVLNAGAVSVTAIVVPKTPYVSNTFHPSPGSSIRLQGTLPDAMDQLTGHVLLDGTPIPIISVSPTEVRGQIPWEEKTGQANLTLTVPSNSPFQQSDLVTITPLAPAIEFADPGQPALLGLKLVKGDFSGLVTSQPGPGDVVIAYFTGLGAVQGKPQTGVPAPADVLFPITGQLTCQFSPRQSPSETVFAGLAPLLTGIYQVILRLPADAGNVPITGLQCTVKNDSGSAGFQLIGAALP